MIERHPRECVQPIESDVARRNAERAAVVVGQPAQRLAVMSVLVVVDDLKDAVPVCHCNSSNAWSTWARYGGLTAFSVKSVNTNANSLAVSP